MKKKLIFCTSKVNAKHIKREPREGVEHIVITSFTLPPDIVMNRGLYPAEEVSKSFKTLERTLAPLEHPEINGQFLSANDPVALNGFYVGAWNENVEQIADGRIKINKVINVQEALKSDKGKRLLDRIAGMEDGSDSRSIHTSVGVFIEIDELDKPQTNAAGEEFDFIARNMVFDHDAILLDSVGAATPKKGVGIGINKEKIDVEFVTYDSDYDHGDAITPETLDLRTNADHKLSFDDIRNELHNLLNEGITDFNEMSFILAIFDDTFVFETASGEMFRSNYTVSDLGDVAIQNTRLPVERVVEFLPINQPSSDEDQTMRDKIIAELEKLGITVNADISDADLLAKHNEALTASNEGDDNADDDPMVNALKSITEKLERLEVKLNSKDSDEFDKLVSAIVSSKKYEGFDVETLKTLTLEKVRSLAANCQASVGIGSTMQVNDDGQPDSYDLPE